MSIFDELKKLTHPYEDEDEEFDDFEDVPRKDAFARLPVIRREELLQMPLEIHYHLVWKRDSVFGKAAGLFLEEVRRRAEAAAASAPRNVPAS